MAAAPADARGEARQSFYAKQQLIASAKLAFVQQGAKHPTWKKAVEGERARFKVIKKGDRYFSVPESWQD